MNFNLLVGTSGNPKLTIFLKLGLFPDMFRKNNIKYIIPEVFFMNISTKKNELFKMIALFGTQMDISSHHLFKENNSYWKYF